MEGLPAESNDLMGRGGEEEWRSKRAFRRWAETIQRSHSDDVSRRNKGGRLGVTLGGVVYPRRQIAGREMGSRKGTTARKGAGLLHPRGGVVQISDDKRKTI